MAKIAINGFGRIGRSFFRAAHGLPGFDIVAINDLADPETLKYLLKYDSVYGRYNKEIKSVKFLAEKDPSKLPWKKLDVDIVIESTGFFTDAVKAKTHLDAGAKRVVITAPAKGDVATALIGVNDDLFEKNKNPITANASCTTNSVAPVMKILLKNFGIKKATMTTVHAYTATQKLVDGPDEKDQRRGRAAAANIVPSSTGAAEAVIQAIPELEGKFNAESIRVPTIAGSLSIITALVDKKASVESINKVFEKAEREEKWSKVLKTTYDPIVSSDIIGEPYGAIIDLSLTKVLDADFVKVFSWYDNEAGYAATLAEHVRRVIENL
ncbi:MAG: Glyceraldehyde-3-phosphate dehydrogenase/erythrose-4-phosphate dehydrogenase [Candidatus Giovannonibacteria bacterium GW2011_GWB1_45_9b]|uniref:Type I glyceraldehyde-3-phosphate dehydrogenase n=4 Tax=Candidatus Giovannoniibacteriota TaxID=1752738 RepID=A0A1F5X0T8_9BACT|nr:MAG: Glyceraldehyde-3-phosphate dehydrogenase/erythrose-4-phosphate dehydrogenase [Candidatus Giovannonibacteria bacterium GW2011_GWB1_45_9b]OGF81515.1 MAG: type I glyceraldehyde-3-phosphate dehydrogenase [Candidatus Giovannonibacteria bacterium RIFCSPHIGHO2_12_44_12]OGF84131.1 MAG: type I glyceraldehyde-3-phosphate dehydrogenase [Candidatus Giovannonibacteria bacterium RIFCSPLOWO2_02_44_8]OGF94183.1 MAG: type I glyceraldehyde-3-phosphate dehydrogenase [Candidatus Giovannonibacteria bacterium